MTTTNQKSPILLRLRALYSPYESDYSDGKLSALLVLDESTCELISSISDIDQSCDISVCLASTQTDIPISEINENLGASAIITVHVPRTNSNFFAQDVNDLVNSGYSYNTPEQYYLYEPDFLSSDSEPNNTNDQYLEVIGFLNQLNLTSAFDHSDENFQGHVSLLFLSPKKKLQLPLLYNFNSLETDANIIQDCTLSISNVFSDSLHTEEKRMLFKTTLVDFLYSRPEESRLTYLINNLKEFCKNFRDNYELFISEFSFENEIERVHQERREFTSKLNDLLAGIQTKLLAVPLTLLISESQLKPIDSFATSVSNVVLVIGMCIFVYIIWLLIQTQLLLLNAVKKEFSAKRVWLLKNLPYNSEELSTQFDGLETMSLDIEKYLKIVRFFAVMSLLYAFILCAYYELAQ